MTDAPRPTVASNAPDRFVVNSGLLEDGTPFVEIVDRFANAGIRLNLITAIGVAGALCQAVVAQTNLMRAKAAAEAGAGKTILAADRRGNIDGATRGN